MADEAVMSQAEKPGRPKLTRESLMDYIDHQTREALAPPDLSPEDKKAIERVDRLVGRWRTNAAHKMEEQRREIERLEKHIEILKDLFAERRFEVSFTEEMHEPPKGPHFPMGRKLAASMVVNEYAWREIKEKGDELEIISILCKRIAELLTKAVLKEARNPDSTRVPLELFPPGPGTKGEE